MADANGMFFVLQFLVVLTIFMVKFYNILRVGELYDIKIAFLLIVGFLLAYGSGFMVMLVNNTELLFRVLFGIETSLVVLTLLFFSLEVIFDIKTRADTVIIAHQPDRGK